MNWGEAIKDFLLELEADLTPAHEKLVNTPPEAPKQPLPATQTPESNNVAPAPNPDALGSDWSNTVVAHHNVRALCDLEGLTYDQKEILTACVYQESQFKIDAIHQNIVDGKVVSTDFGIVQVNDFYHIGPGKDFPSSDYVLTHPEECVRWMCQYYKQHGNLNAWVSYTSKAYEQWLGKV